jgi:hypothetical protein
LLFVPGWALVWDQGSGQPGREVEEGVFLWHLLASFFVDFYFQCPIIGTLWKFTMGISARLIKARLNFLRTGFNGGFVTIRPRATLTPPRGWERGKLPRIRYSTQGR